MNCVCDFLFHLLSQQLLPDHNGRCEISSNSFCSNDSTAEQASKYLLGCYDQSLIKWPHDIQRMTFCIMTLSIMAISIMAISIMTLSIMTLSIITNETRHSAL